MSKFCGNCGSQMDDNAVVCGNCGCSMSDNKTTFKPSDPEQDKAKKSKIKKIIGICAAVVAVALVVVICFNFIGGRSYKSVVDTYIEASIKEPDAAAALELFPDELLSKSLRDEGMTRTEAVKKLQDSLDSAVEQIEKYCDDWSVSWEVVDIVDASNSEVKYLSDDCEDLYDFKVSAKKDLTVEIAVEVTVDGETKTNTQDLDLTLIKSGKSWYLWGIEGSSIDSLF